MKKYADIACYKQLLMERQPLHFSQNAPDHAMRNKARRGPKVGYIFFLFSTKEVLFFLLLSSAYS